MKKMNCRILLLMGCIGLMCSNPIAVNAQEIGMATEDIISDTGVGDEVESDSYDSVMQIIVTYTADDGTQIPLGGGSGFLVGDDDSQLQYMITAKSVVSVSDSIKSELGIEDSKTTIKVVISKDVTVTASIYNSSDSMDFVILKLSQPVCDRHALVLNDKGIDTYLDDNVFVIGYPTAAMYGEETVYYSDSQLLSKKGYLEEEENVDGQKFVSHHIYPSYGNIGGPIVDVNGTVLAINQSVFDGKSFYAVEISEVTCVMDSFGIPYRTITQVEEEQAEIAAQEEEQRKAQEEEIKQKQLEEAQKKEELERANAKKQLILTVSIACIILVTAIIMIVLKLTAAKRKARKLQKQAEFTVSEPSPVFGQAAKAHEPSYKALVNAGNGRIDETMVLSNSVDSSLTSVLSQNSISLVRTRNGENIAIRKFPFAIGKDGTRSDYCVNDNPAVSRLHATILNENNQYVIKDNNATNGTYVNGQIVPSGMSSPIYAGSVIELGDEKFEVCINV